MISQREREIIELCYSEFGHHVIARTGPVYLSEEDRNQLEEIFKDYFLREREEI